MADSNAPFGLTWGANEEEIASLGVEFDGGEDGQNGRMFMAKGLPKPIPDVESVALFFTDGGELWRIVGVFKATSGDPFGNTTIKRYLELKESLANRYGRPNESKLINQYYSAENFVLGLSTGENYLYSDFSSAEVSAQLAVRAGSIGDSFCILIYESKEFKRVFESERRARELDAL